MIETPNGDMFSVRSNMDGVDIVFPRRVPTPKMTAAQARELARLLLLAAAHSNREIRREMRKEPKIKQPSYIYTKP